MKIFNRNNEKKAGEADRFSQVFFVIGAIIVFTVVFFLGMQVGRVVEKEQAKRQDVRKGERRVKDEIRRDMSAYSEEAVRIPVVMPPPPPAAGEELNKTGESANLPDLIALNDPAPQPQAPPKESASVPASKPKASVPAPKSDAFAPIETATKAPATKEPVTKESASKPAAGSSTKKTFMLQASALRNREAANSLKAKLEKKGFQTRILREVSDGKELYKVRVGPYGSKEEAAKAVKDIRAAFNIDAIILNE